MEKKYAETEPFTPLRRRAEDIIREKIGQPPDKLMVLPPEELRQMFHELHVHQIELEVQNDELRRAHVELDAVRARYFDLYDLAPVGYCSLNEKGLILESNLTAANLLGMARDVLVKQSFTRFIYKEDQDIYYLQQKKLGVTQETQVCELRMLKKDAGVFWAQLSTTAVRDIDGVPVVLVVMSDAPERKRVGDEQRQSELALAAQGERQRLARDLHDAVSQTLFSARLIAETLVRQRETISTEMLWSNLRDITRLVVSALGEMRILLLEMRPEGLVNAELSSLLTHLVDASTSRTEANVIPTIQAGTRLPLEAKIAIYRIAQEAINNTIKHANATEINLSLTQDDFGVQLIIKDNGRGFDLQKFPDDRFGVRIMAERAHKVGAALQIDSQPNQGTCVTCRWPQNGSNYA